MKNEIMEATNEEIETAMKYLRLAKKHGTIGRVIDSCAELEEIGTAEEFRKLKEEYTETLLKDGQLLYQQGILDGYDKAVDEVVMKIKAELDRQFSFGGVSNKMKVFDLIDETAKQMKMKTEGEDA